MRPGMPTPSVTGSDSQDPDATAPDDAGETGGLHRGPARRPFLDRRRVARCAALLVAAAVLAAYFYNIARRSHPGDSDGATLLLQGQSFAHGNVLLDGWRNLYDSFWTVEVPVYGIFELFTGLDGQLLYVVPATFAAVTTLLCCGLAVRGRPMQGRRAAAVGAVVTVLAVIALPTGDWTFLFLRGGWHIATLMWCLLAFLALRDSRSRVGWIVAAVILGLAMLGDLQALLVGVLPAFFAGLVAMVRGRSWRTGAHAVAAAVGAGVVAVAVRKGAQLIGTYDIGKANNHANTHQQLLNLRHLPRQLLRAFGVGPGALGPVPGPEVLSYLRVVGVAIAAVAVVGAVVVLVSGMVRGAHRTTGEAWQVDDLLLLTLLGDLAFFVVITPGSSLAYVRYLMPAVVISSVLAGRLVGRAVERLPRRAVGVTAVAGLVVVALLAANVVPASTQPVKQLNGASVAAFLDQHDLHDGIGAYWVAAVVTTASGDRVQVRPVSAESSTGAIVRYGKQSTRDWYKGKSFQFLIWSTASPSFHIDDEKAIQTFGAPEVAYTYETYRILVWDHPIMVDPDRYQG